MDLSEPAAVKMRFALRRLNTLLAGIAILLFLDGCACKGVYPLQVEHRAAPVSNSRSPTQAIALRVVTFNVWGLPTWLNGAPPSRYGLIARELERLDPDLVLLQEVWTRRATKVVPRHRAWSIAVSAGQTSIFRRNGLVALSRFPIVGGEFHAFGSAAFPDSLVSKGALKITIELPNARRVNVWNVHLQSDGARAVRLRQIQELIAWIHGAQDGQVADVIGGDFNCTPDSRELLALTQHLGPTVNQLSQSRFLATYDGLSTKPGEACTLDYCFFRARSSMREFQANLQVVFTADDPRVRLSDHLGLEASLHFAPASGDGDAPLLVRFSPRAQTAAP